MRVSHLEHPLLGAPITAALAFTVYWLSLAQDLTWAYNGADGAELITAAVTLGIPHPPGYPLYVMLGKLISLVPMGTVAFRFNMLSAISMALAAGLISGLIMAVLGQGPTRDAPAGERKDDRAALTMRLLTALAAGLCFAFLPLVWKQALIAEVYALNMLFVSMALWLMFGRPTPRVAFFLGVALGLSVTTHLTSLLLFIPALVVLRGVHRIRLGLGALAGLSPFLALPLFASGDSPVVWGRIDGVAEWWWLVSARLYQPNVLSLPADAWPARLAAWSSEPTLWIAVALLILIIVRRRLSPLRAIEPLSTALLATAILYFGYSFTYDANDAIVTLLPALAILCLLAGLALGRATALYLLLPLTLLVLNFQHIDLSKDTGARALAEPPLREAPQDAIIVTTGDHATFTLWYLQHVEGQRADVVVVDGNLLAFDWYRSRLASANPSLDGLERDDLPAFRQLNNGRRPWCELQIAAGNIVQYRCEELAT